MTKYTKGSIVTGNVTGIESYGAFVGLDDYYSGLIHISEISDNYIKDINDYIKLGETIKAKVIEVDEESYHIKLSIKDIKQKQLNVKKQPIQEKNSGFKILADNLDYFIKIKLEEYSKK